jgi:hypothetical protein
VSWEAIETIGQKIGLFAIVVFLGYVILRLVARFLVDVTIWSNTDTQELSGDATGAQESGDEPVEAIPGLHVLSEYGDQHRFLDKSPTEETIRTTIRGLDWVGGFHQVLLVTAPGVSLEVGGSLDPDDGLASVHRDLKNKVYRVTREPPTTVENMEDLLVSFHLGDGRWEQMYDYEQIPSSVT